MTVLTDWFTSRRIIAAIVLMLLTGGIVALRTGDGTVRVSAYFATTLGVYEGSEVRLMGVPIGTVTEIDPDGQQVRVDFEYDASYDLPADAKAVIISPSVVADRFVQLTPAYDGSGPTLADGAEIPIARTRVPVELDEVYTAADELLRGLGPNGANDDGALNRLLAVGADTLDGQGQQLQQLLANLSGAADTLGDSSGELFEGVGHLERFTRSLAADDDAVQRFNQQMASVARFLADEREHLSGALNELAGTFGLVETFVKANRALLTRNVDRLTKLSSVLLSERDALVSVLRVLPVAGSNMLRTWDPVNQSIRARANEGELLNDIGGILCDALQREGVPNPAQLCALLDGLVGEVTP